MKIMRPKPKPVCLWPVETTHNWDDPHPPKPIDWPCLETLRLAEAQEGHDD